MNIEQLQALWKSQPAGTLPDETQLLNKIKEESRAFDRVIRRRDWREFIAAIVAAAVFALPMRKSVGPLWVQITAIGVILLVPLFAVVARLRLRRKLPPVGSDLRTELGRAIAEMRLQVRLLKTVAWWYLLPLWIAVLLLEVRWHGELTARALKLQVFVIAPFNVFVYWLNQRAVRKKLQPQLDQLLALREQWDVLATDGSAPPPGNDAGAT